MTEDWESHIVRTGDLLRTTFGNKNTTGAAYLRWLYLDNPDGTPVQGNRDDGLGRTAHYMGVPQTYARGEETASVHLAVNAAVAERARGQKLFVATASEMMEAADARGTTGVIGVSNQNATPGSVKYLGYRLVRSLPVTVGLALRQARGVLTGEPAIARLLELEAARSEAGWARRYDETTLLWRLACPAGPYTVVASETAAVVASRTTQGGLPFTVILGTFASQPTDIMPLVGTACRTVGPRLFVHAGFNADTRLRGIPVPKRLRPAPLNMIWRAGAGGEAFAPEELRRFEFLDFDLY